LIYRFAIFWEIEFWHWWAFAVLLIALEAFVACTLLLWPGISAAVIGLVVLIRPELSNAPVLGFVVYKHGIMAALVQDLAHQVGPPESEHPGAHLCRPPHHPGGGPR
jgi:membrane protein implicated in regulation of membrane protease activity